MCWGGVERFGLAVVGLVIPVEVALALLSGPRFQVKEEETQQSERNCANEDQADNGEHSCLPRDGQGHDYCRRTRTLYLIA